MLQQAQTAQMAFAPVARPQQLPAPAPEPDGEGIPAEITSKLLPLQQVVLRGLLKGESVLEICSRSELSQRDVTTHIGGIYRALNVQSPEQLFNEVYGDLDAEDLVPIYQRYRLRGKQQEVLAHLLKGQSSEEIAAILEIDVDAVLERIAAVQDKMRVDTKESLLAIVHREIRTVSKLSDEATLDDKEHGSIPPAILKKLKPQNIKVLEHFLRGQNVDAIAKAMQLSKHTVADYFKEIHKRLGVKSREHLLYKIFGDADSDGFQKFCKYFKLSDAEKAALACVLKGKTHTETAGLLNTTPTSINSRFKEIRRKTGVGPHAASIFFFVHDQSARILKKIEENDLQQILLWKRGLAERKQATFPTIDNPAPSAP